MRRSVAFVLLSALVLCIMGALAAQAAPSRDLNTVREGQLLATKKQWFVPVDWSWRQGPPLRRIIGSPVSSAKEFYDNVRPDPYPPEGPPWGGFASSGAIRGVIFHLDYIDGNPPPLTGFEVRAEVTNDLYMYQKVLSGTSAMNAHWQSAPDIVGQQPDFMYEVRLTAEFADDDPWSVFNLPTVYPFGPESSIITYAYDYLSWYSFTLTEAPPFPFVAPGGYWVPTFSMTGSLAQDPWGTPDVILPGETHSRDLVFILRTGLPPGDPLRTWLESAMANGDDLFMNRAGDLKIAWYPESMWSDSEQYMSGGDVSVFYSTEPPGKDWGDAPDPGYPTLAIRNGASHTIVPYMYLGAGIDGEPDGQPDPAALGDDNNGIDDEDGVRFTSPINPGGPATVQVTASVTGMLDAWVDFDNNGNWTDAGDQIFTSQQLVGGVNSLTFQVPSTYLPGTPLFARFRFSAAGGLSFAGPAYDGEVEDYEVRIEEPVNHDLGDAPDSTNNSGAQMTAYPGVAANFPTVFGAGSPPYGPIHLQPLAMAYLGNAVTLENEADIGPDQDPTNNIIPQNNVPDRDVADDGVQMPLVLPNCTSTTFNYTVTVVNPMPTMFVNVWFDWDRNGDWDGTMQCPTGPAPEWAVQNQSIGPLAPGTYTLTTPAFLPWHPVGAPTQPIWMRITLSELPWQPSGGPGDGGSGPPQGYQFGETEDYYFTPDLAPQDFGDAPDPTYPTLRANNGARHDIVTGMFLGNAIDAENDGQPEAQALGDDVNGVPNEEDGVRGLSMLTPGQPGFFNVVASVPGMLDAWIDFDGDGTWTQAADQICASQALVAGFNPVNFIVPPTANPGVTFARLRYSRQGGLPFFGPAPDGEVEDYLFRITDNVKWMQPPDLSDNGIDVNASTSFILADDFECTTTGPITDIHIWGSWLNDLFPGGNAGGFGFTLSIHEDIPDPDGPGPEFSKPGRVLWKADFPPWAYDFLHVATVPQGEGWLDPPLGYIYPGDTMVLRYDFYLDRPWIEPFIQRGTRDNPVVYWLDVQHNMIDQPPPAALFGWKTSPLHWNDDAVWGQGTEPYDGPWNELRYPQGHPEEGRSIDLAFAITGHAMTDDWGDAPDGPYPTLSTSNGAHHFVMPGFCLGSIVDVDPDGQPDPNALGDDNDGDGADEDGLTFVSALVPGQPATMTIVASAAGMLDAWIDFSADGSWAEPGDQVFASQGLVAGPNDLTFVVPLTGKPGFTFARLRFSSLGGLPFTGPAQDGEVEDYMVFIGEGGGPEKDWGDAPDPSYPTLSASGGASHVIVPGFFLGASIDGEPDGQPDPSALGDDNAGIDDEDGVVFVTPFISGLYAVARITVSANGFIDIWYDGNGDGDWTDPGEQTATGAAVTTGNNNWVYIPVGGAPGTTTFMRFRFSSTGGLAPGGPAPDGEVEDYQITVAPEKPPKWTQPPDYSPMGMDVYAEKPRILADDFKCTESGPITKIIVWYSNYDDMYPYPEPEITLSIHADIPDPDGEGPLYSMPGETLWQCLFLPCSGLPQTPCYTGYRGAYNLNEGWYDPKLNFYDPTGDTICRGYMFTIPYEMAFIQRGTPEEPKVYWLDLQAMDRTGDPETYKFGWKTSATHWNDDAVWTEGTEPYNGLWNELRYPPGHPMEGQSVDLAFELYGQDLDCGDAPDPTYPTLLASSGASHNVVPGICLGTSVDRDPDGQPDPNALGDDNAGIDDEDGVTFLTPLVPGSPGYIDVVANVPGDVSGWIDFNADGDWDDPDDSLGISYANAGSNVFTIWVPPTAPGGMDTYARFRFGVKSGWTGPRGYSIDGEVEDYKVYIYPNPVVVTKGDAKKRPVGTYVCIYQNAVTANFGLDSWYFEELNRSAGLGVIPPPRTISPWQVGDLVSCYGTTTLNGCELMLQEIYSWYEGQARVDPVGQNNRGSGGGAFWNQPGLFDDVGVPTPAGGLNTVALLAKLWGRCTYIETDPADPTVQLNFWINDGSALWDGTLDPPGNQVLGVKVRVPANLPPIVTGNYYTVVGIMRTAYDPTGLYCVRWLWPRTNLDIRVIP